MAKSAGTAGTNERFIGKPSKKQRGQSGDKAGPVRGQFYIVKRNTFFLYITALFRFLAADYWFLFQAHRLGRLLPQVATAGQHVSMQLSEPHAPARRFFVLKMPCAGKWRRLETMRIYADMDARRGPLAPPSTAQQPARDAADIYKLWGNPINQRSISGAWPRLPWLRHEAKKPANSCLRAGK